MQQRLVAFRGYDLNDDDLLSRDEFIVLYSAYTHITFLRKFY